MSRICPKELVASGTCRAAHKPRSNRRAVTCFASSASADSRGTPSTAYRTVARCSASSARRGHSAVVLQPVTTRSALPRTGCARCFDQARRGTLPGMVRTGATFADAAAEFLRYVEHDRAAEALDAARLSLDRQRVPAAGVRSEAAGGHHGARRGAVALQADERGGGGADPGAPESSKSRATHRSLGGRCRTAPRTGS